MAETKSEQEPSIEEILESIRQIISEDGETPAPAPQAAPQPAPVMQTVAAPVDDDVIDLTEKVMPAAPAIDLREVPPQIYSSDLDLSAKAQPPVNSDTLLSAAATDLSAHAIARLLQGNMSVERELPGRPGNVTLEDMTRDMLRPLLKTWLDQNLPGLIEKLVAKEIEKISRLALKQ